MQHIAALEQAATPRFNARYLLPSETMLPMQLLPTSCPAAQIPDSTGLDVFSTASTAVKERPPVFFTIGIQGRRWTVDAGALAPHRYTDDRDGAPGSVTHLTRSLQGGFRRARS